MIEQFITTDNAPSILDHILTNKNQVQAWRTVHFIIWYGTALERVINTLVYCFFTEPKSNILAHGAVLKSAELLVYICAWQMGQNKTKEVQAFTEHIAHRRERQEQQLHHQTYNVPTSAQKQQTPGGCT